MVRLRSPWCKPALSLQSEVGGSSCFEVPLLKLQSSVNQNQRQESGGVCVDRLFSAQNTLTQKQFLHCQEPDSDLQ